MKKDRMYLLIAGAVMLLVIAGVSVLSVKFAAKDGNGIGAWGFSFGGRTELRNTIEIPLAQAESVSLKYRSKNIYIYPSQEEKVIVREYLHSKSPKALAAVTYGDEKEVTIKEGNANTFVVFGFWGWEERIEVYLPENRLREFSAETKSGNIKAEADGVKEDGVLTLSAGSGNINLENTNGKKIILESGSGNITGEDLEGAVDAEANSGNIRLKSLKGSGSLESGSGNITAVFDEVTGDIALEAGSGNVKLEIPAELAFRLQADSGSGNIQTDFDQDLSFNQKGNSVSGEVGENPLWQIEAETGSGNIHIGSK